MPLIVRGLIAETGEVVERYEYTPYGQRTVYTTAGSADPAAHTPTLMSQRVELAGVAQPYALNPLGHQGLLHDEATSLVYNRARMLHPRLGRFLQRDPLGYVDGMSVYVYYAGMHGTLDYSGLFTESLARKISGILFWRGSIRGNLGTPFANYLWDSIFGDVYRIEDSDNELMSDFRVVAKLEKAYYEIIDAKVQSGELEPSGSWKKYYFRKGASAQRIAGQFYFSGGGKLPTESEFWLNGAQDVKFSGGTAEFKCAQNGGLWIRNINIQLEWHDNIDAQSFIESYRSGMFDSVGSFISDFAEGIWDIGNDKLRDVNYGIIIDFSDTRSQQRLLGVSSTIYPASTAP